MSREGMLSMREWDRPAGQIEVADEHPHDPIDVQALEDFQRVGQVIEITSLVALQQRTQLGRQHLLSRERGNGRLAGKPGIRDFERPCLGHVECLDLAGVDLDLQPDLRAAAVLGLRAKAELRRDRALTELRPPEPRLQHETQPVEDRPDGPPAVRTRSMSSE